MAPTEPPRISIADLPVELIRHICSFLTPRCVIEKQPYPCRDCVCRRPGCHTWFKGQPDVSRLSRTCKPLRDVVQPFVFQCYPDYGSRPAHRLISFVRTLIARPDLRHHVRVLTFTEDGRAGLDLADKQLVHTTAVQLGLSDLPDYWSEEHDYRLLPLELALVHTPNLEYLRMPLDYDWTFHLLPRLAEAAHPPSFPRLKAIEVREYFIAGDRFDASTEPVETLARLAPNLDSLCLPDPNWLDCGGGDGAFAPLPSLRRLYWQQPCSANMKQMAGLLAGAPRLEVLALPWDAMAAYDDFCDDRTTTEAWDAVAVRKDTLRELRLDVRCDTAQGEGERDSLRDFERLEVLKVDGTALETLRRAWKRKNGRAKVDSFLSTFFPPSIREVTFWRPDGREMEAAMLRLAKVAAVGRYPNLKSVVLAPSEKSDRQGYYDEWVNADNWNGVKHELEELFGQGGVKFELRWDSPYWTGGSLD